VWKILKAADIDLGPAAVRTVATSPQNSGSSSSTTTLTGRTGHFDSSRPPVPLPHVPARPSGDVIVSADSSTSTCTWHDVSEFAAPRQLRSQDPEIDVLFGDQRAFVQNGGSSN
jgi:hypothetical protein